MSFFPSVRVSIQLALRARFGLIAFWLIIITSIAAWLSAQFSGRQPATVALDVGISVIRVVLPVLGILMLQELISREFERRHFLSSLTYPRSRCQFLLGRFLGLLILLLIFLVVNAAVLAAVVFGVERGYAQGTPVVLGVPYLVTVLFIFVDLLVILSVGVFLAVAASTPSFIVIGAIGFMLISRSFSTIVYLLQHDGWLVSNPELYGGSLGLLMYLMPDLAALDVRMLSLYGRMEFLPVDWPWLTLTSIAYAFAFLAMAIFTLNKKRFV